MGLTVITRKIWNLKKELLLRRQNFQPKILYMKMCRKGHKTQKKIVEISKIRLKYFIFIVLRSKARILQ